jgi:hypothetical protein
MPLDEATLDRMLGNEWRERLPPICPECGYNLTGLPDNRCPECGYIYSRNDVRRNAQNMVYMIHQLKDVNDVARIGLWIGLAAAAVMVLAKLCGVFSLGRIVGILAGLPTIGLGLQVFRVRQLPDWAVDFMPIKPGYSRGMLVALLGLVLLVAAALAP